MVHDSKKLKYTGTYVPVIVYDNGMESWVNIEGKFRGVSVRNRVVCRLDLFEDMRDFYSNETVEKFRDLLLYVTTGQANTKELLSQYLTALAEEDDVFRNKLTSILKNLPMDKDFGHAVLREICYRFLVAEEEFRHFFRGRDEQVICVSDCYLYFSVTDSKHEVLLPKEYKVEVISNAKSWDGSISIVR